MQTQTNPTRKACLINSTNHTQKPRLRERTDRAWFSRLLRHPTRKRSGSILSSWTKLDHTRRPSL